MPSASSTFLGLRARLPAEHLDYVFANALEGESCALYDAVTEHGSFAQTRAWAKVASAGRSKTPRFLLVRRDGHAIGAALVLQTNVLGIPAPDAIVERGPVARTIDDLDAVLSALRRACLARGIVRVRVMPYWSGVDAMRAEYILAERGFSCVQTFDAAHARTVRIPLDEPLPRPIASELRRAERAGARARMGGTADVPAFERLQRNLMRAQGLPEKPRAWFDAVARFENGALFVCEHERSIVSIVFVVKHGPLATYVAGATTGVACSFSKTAPSIMAAIEWARAQGCNAFDLGGIPLEGDPDPKRQRIARFKRSFARRPIALTREHERWF